MDLELDLILQGKGGSDLESDLKVSGFDLKRFKPTLNPSLLLKKICSDSDYLLDVNN